MLLHLHSCNFKFQSSVIGAEYQVSSIARQAVSSVGYCKASSIKSSIARQAVSSRSIARQAVSSRLLQGKQYQVVYCKASSIKSSIARQAVSSRSIARQAVSSRSIARQAVSSRLSIARLSVSSCHLLQGELSDPSPRDLRELIEHCLEIITIISVTTRCETTS